MTQLLQKEAIAEVKTVSGIVVQGDTVRATSTMTAKLKSLNVAVGQFVKQGEVIAVVETSPSLATQQGAEQRYNNLLTEIANLKDALDELTPENQVQYINLQNKLLGLERARDAAKQTLTEVQEGWEDFNLRSTVTGHVISLADLSDTNLVKGQVLYTVVPYFVQATITPDLAEQWGTPKGKEGWNVVASSDHFNPQTLNIATWSANEAKNTATISIVNTKMVDTPVTLTFTKETAEGFWIPKAALITKDGETFIQIVQEDQTEMLLAVKVRQTVGNKYEIEGENLAGKILQVNP